MMLWALGVVCLLFLANFWLTPWGVPALRRQAGGEIQVDLRLYYQPEDLHRLLERYGPLGRTRFHRMLLLDMVFPAAYAAFLSGLALAAGRGSGSVAVAAMAVTAALMDYGENIFLLRALARWPEVAEADARRASWFTSAKVASLLATLGMLAVMAMA